MAKIDDLRWIHRLVTGKQPEISTKDNAKVIMLLPTDCASCLLEEK